MTDNNQNNDELAEKLKKAQEEAEQKNQEEQEEQTDQDQDKDIQTKLDEMTEYAKRSMADLQNLKRRQKEEKSTWIKMANAELVKALLPTLDNLERAKDHLPENETTEGLIMSINQFHKTLNDFGLTPMETIDQKFDPDLHQAMAQDEEGEKDIITEEFEKGYLIGDKVIRHAKVKVGNKN